MKNKRLGEHFAAGRQGDVWKELKKTSNNKKPSNIDGMVDDDEIVNLFAEKIETCITLSRLILAL